MLSGGLAGSLVNVVSRLLETYRMGAILESATIYSLVNELEEAERIFKPVADDNKVPLVMVQLPYFVCENVCARQPHLFPRLNDLRMLFGTYVYYAKNVNQLIDARMNLLTHEQLNETLIQQLEHEIIQICQSKYHGHRGNLPYTVAFLVATLKSRADLSPYNKPKKPTILKRIWTSRFISWIRLVVRRLRRLLSQNIYYKDS